MKKHISIGNQRSSFFSSLIKFGACDSERFWGSKTELELDSAIKHHFFGVTHRKHVLIAHFKEVHPGRWQRTSGRLLNMIRAISSGAHRTSATFSKHTHETRSHTRTPAPGGSCVYFCTMTHPRCRTRTGTEILIGKRRRKRISPVLYWGSVF